MENKSNKPKKETAKKTKEEIKKEMAARNTNEYFVKTAERRTENVINAINKLGYVAKYPHTPEQKEKIMLLIGTALDEMSKKFDGKTKKEKIVVKL